MQLELEVKCLCCCITMGYIILSFFCLSRLQYVNTFFTIYIFGLKADTINATI